VGLHLIIYIDTVVGVLFWIAQRWSSSEHESSVLNTVERR